MMFKKQKVKKEAALITIFVGRKSKPLILRYWVSMRGGWRPIIPEFLLFSERFLET